MLNIIFSCLLSFSFFHPIHNSVTKINHNTSTKNLEVIHKIFLDDLEYAIEQHYQVKLFLGTKGKERKDKKEWIEKYLKEFFAIKLNNKTVELKWEGMQMDLEAATIYRYYPNVKKVKNIFSRNEIIFNLHDDQQNILHVRANGNLQTYRAYKDHQEFTFHF